MDNTLFKTIPAEMLPVLSRAIWDYAAYVMRRAYGGEILAKAALSGIRREARMIESLVELNAMLEETGSVHIPVFRNDGEFYDRDVLDYAVERYAEETERYENEWHNALALLGYWVESPWTDKKPS